MIRKTIVFLMLGFILFSCGGSDPSYPGTWDGTLTLSENSCKFIHPRADVNAILPVTVTDDGHGDFTVTFADGRTAPAIIEANILVARTNLLGDLGTTEGSNCVSAAVFQIFDSSGSTSDISETITFTNCTISGQLDTSFKSCDILYKGAATQR